MQSCELGLAGPVFSKFCSPRPHLTKAPIIVGPLGLERTGNKDNCISTLIRKICDHFVDALSVPFMMKARDSGQIL